MFFRVCSQKYSTGILFLALANIRYIEFIVYLFLETKSSYFLQVTQAYSKKRIATSHLKQEMLTG